MESLAREPRVFKSPAPTVELDTLGPISTILMVHAWVQNNDYQAILSDIKKRVRQALQDAEVNAPVPVPAPAVAPWQPPPEKPADERANKPN